MMEVSESRLAVAIIAVFSLGILLSILNGYYIENTGSAMPLETYGVAGVSMFVGALIILLFQWKISTKNALSLLKILPEDERKILEVLLNEKKIEQTYLVAESGLSKVKVSRVVSKLEQRGVVEKKPLGNTNLIKLKI
ncbi:MAG TPA: winged helix-turn-helix transcriptional regulator [Candidatus Altiarchaeales archaeon]|nr:winged helix-turn-helix transcriptional regulator [Candidatus Altiarchaeales archaeon]